MQTFEDIHKTATGYQRAKLLLSALSLGLFETLAEGEKSGAEAASALGLDARATEIAANALTAMGLLEKKGERYANGETAARYLVKGSPDYRGFILHHLLRSWEDWADFDTAWRTGQARCARKSENIPADDDGLKDFILGMENMTRELAPKIAALLPLAEAKKVLDVGGGPGNYCLAFAQKAPKARVFHLDLPRTSALAREFVRGKPGAERIDFIAGDFDATPWGEGYDLIYVSQFLHMLGEPDAENLIRKAGQALAPGGVLAVHEHFLNDDKTSPLSAALFGTHMLAVTPCGRAYSFAEIETWMGEAGIGAPRRVEYGGSSRLLLGTKG